MEAGIGLFRLFVGGGVVKGMCCGGEVNSTAWVKREPVFPTKKTDWTKFGKACEYCGNVIVSRVGRPAPGSYCAHCAVEVFA